MKNIYAYTPHVIAPPYISINLRQDGKYYITVRNQKRAYDEVPPIAEIEIPFEEMLKMGAACMGLVDWDSEGD